jgi:gluconolactonase
MAGEPAVPGLLLRVDAPGAATVISERLLWPNGIGAAPDGARLYVSDFARKHVLAMAPDGTGEAVFAEVPRGSADGLAVDEEGGVWVALGDGCGVVRFTADGALDEVVDVPAEFVSSIAFGGQDRRDVAITTVGAVFVARSEVAGVRVEPAAV